MPRPRTRGERSAGHEPPPDEGFVSAADLVGERETDASRPGGDPVTSSPAPSSPLSASGPDRRPVDPGAREPGFPAGLDPRVVAAVRMTGVESLYPPQYAAMEAVLAGHNVLVAVPTASGKSLVAHQTILHTLLQRGGKAIYIVPLRALAMEKYEELRELAANLEGVNLRVALATGELDEADTRLGGYDVVVTTSEKADSLVRHGAGWFHELSVAVADEVHLIGDSGRGPTLEVTLARLLGLTEDVRLVALSATVTNAQEVADWLGATLVQSDWRPVPLREGVFLGDAIVFADNEVKKVDGTGDPVVRLVADVAGQDGQALVFVSTRRSTEATAKKIAQDVKKRLAPATAKVLEEAARRLEVEDGESSRLGARLARVIRGGAAFHNAGLSAPQRRSVETLFKQGHLRAIVATPTLAAGVNLPARRVVVRDLKRFSPAEGSVPLPVLEVKQMTGRAGRPRYDTHGEAVLVARNQADLDEYMDVYLNGEVEPVQSALAQESALRIHLLAGVAAGLTVDRDAVHGFMAATFLARDPYAGAKRVLQPRVDMVLEFLLAEGFIEEDDAGGLVATRFGGRVSSLYVDPMSAIMIRDGLAMTGLVPQVEDLALLALIAGTPDVPALWLRRGDEWVEALAEENEGRWLRPAPLDAREQERFLSELKTALLLYDWIGEARLESLEERYGLGPGDIQNRVQIAAWLLYAAEEIARLEGHDASQQLNRLKRRVQAGVRADLLPLLALKGVGRYRARVLAQAGYRSMARLRKASVERLLGLPGFGVRVVARLLSQLGRAESLQDVERAARGRGAPRASTGPTKGQAKTAGAAGSKSEAGKGKADASSVPGGHGRKTRQEAQDDGSASDEEGGERAADGEKDEAGDGHDDAHSRRGDRRRPDQTRLSSFEREEEDA